MAKKLRRNEVDPAVREVANYIRDDIKAHDYSQKELAKRLGLTASSVSKYLHCLRDFFPLEIVMEHGRMAKRRLINLEDARWNAARLHWDPGADEPRLLLDRLADHRGDNITFTRQLQSFISTPDVLEHVHAVGFEGFEGYRNYQLRSQALKLFGVGRTAHFRKFGTRARTIMFKSDFLRLIERRRPYSTCELWQVAEQLEYLREECMKERDYRLYLLPDDVSVEIRDGLSGLHSLTTIGDSVVSRRNPDYTFDVLEGEAAVEPDRAFLKALLKLAEPVNEDALKAYQDEVERAGGLRH